MCARSFQKEPPKLAALSVEHAEFERNAQKSLYRFEPVILVRLRNVLRNALQRIKRATIVLTRFVDRAHDPLITGDESLNIHLGNKVNCGDRIVACRVGAQKTAFFLETLPELRVRQRIQHPDHGHRNRAFANKLDLTFENVFWIVVKPDDEPGHHFHAVALYSADRFKQVAAVLRLLCFLETLLHRSFDTEKHSTEPGFLHRRQQIVVVSQIHTRFGQQRKGITILLLPIDQRGQQQTHVLLVADKIVVHDEQWTSPAQPFQFVELGDDLLFALGARDSAVDLDDVAKLT